MNDWYLEQAERFGSSALAGLAGDLEFPESHTVSGERARLAAHFASIVLNRGNHAEYGRDDWDRAVVGAGDGVDDSHASRAPRVAEQLQIEAVVRALPTLRDSDGYEGDLISRGDVLALLAAFQSSPAEKAT